MSNGDEKLYDSSVEDENRGYIYIDECVCVFDCNDIEVFLMLVMIQKKSNFIQAEREAPYLFLVSMNENIGDDDTLRGEGGDSIYGWLTYLIHEAG